MEGTAKVFDAVHDMGTDGGGGMRCCSFTPTIRSSPRVQIVKGKKNIPNRSELFSKRIPGPTIQGCSSNSGATYRSPATASFIASISHCIHHLRILGGILSSPSFGAKSSSSFSDIVWSGGRSSEDSCVLEVGRDRVGCGGEAGEGI